MRQLVISFALILVLVVTGCAQKEEEAKKPRVDITGKSTAPKPPETPPQETTAPAFGTNDAGEKIHAIRSEDNAIVTLETSHGNLVLELYRDVAPAHADSFLARTKDGFYSGTIFHRIMRGFMAQGGDPSGTGRGDAGYRLPAEFSQLPHKEGTLSAARGPDVNSASCQFFVCFGRNRSTSGLDGKYTVFGQLLLGYDVLHKMENVKTIPSPGGSREVSKPEETLHLIKAYVSDAEGNPL